MTGAPGPRDTARLLIVYNADAGPVAALIDLLHKIVSPATYPCALCAVTYGPVAMKAAWRDYLATLPLAVAFFHRPDFHAAYPALADAPLPLIARDDRGEVAVLLDAAALARLTSVDALIAALARRLADGAAAAS